MPVLPIRHRPSLLPTLPRLRQGGLALLLLTLAACVHRDGGDFATGGLRAPTGPTYELMQLAGERAAVTLLLEPQRFPELRVLSALLPNLERDMREPLQQALQAPTLWAGLGVLLKTLRGDAAWPPELTGWDERRPLVLSLFEAPTGNLGELALAFLGQPTGSVLPRVRHHLIIPARDAKALAATLHEVLTRNGLTASAPGVYQERHFLVSVQPARTHVRVTVLPLSEKPSGEDLALLQAPPAPPPPPGSPTPALLYTLTQPGVLTAYVRPANLRQVSFGMGSTAVLAALASVEPSMKDLLGLKGWTEMAGGDQLLSSSNPETLDVAFSFTAPPGSDAQLASVVSLSAAAQAMYKSAQQSAYRPLPRSTGPTLAHVALGLNVAELLQRVELPDGLLAAHSKDMINRVRGCGAPCFAYLGFSHPMGALKLAASATRERWLDQLLPQGGDVTLNDVLVLLPRGALAVAFRTVPQLQRLLALLDEGLGPGGMIRIAHSETPLPDGRTAIRAGVGLEPSSIYDGSIAPPDTGVLSLEVNVAAVAGMFGRGVQQELAGVGQLRSRATLEGPALVSQLVVTPTGLTPAPLPALPVLAKSLRGGQAPAPSPTDGPACLHQLVDVMIQAFDMAVSLDPSQRRTILLQAAQQSAQAQTCAEQDASTRDVAVSLKRALAVATQRLSLLPTAP